MTGFKIYNGTKEAFIDSGKASINKDAIVFITGGTEGDKSSCIYTQGSYFGSITELMKAINYVKGITVGGTSYNVAAGGGYVAFSSTDPATVKIAAGQSGIEIGLDATFVNKVNEISTIKSALGSEDDLADVEGSAFARIANLTELVSDLTGGSTESVAGQIGNAINKFKEDLFGTLDDKDAKTLQAINDELDGLDQKVQSLETAGFIKIGDVTTEIGKLGGSASSASSNKVQVTVTTKGGQVNTVSVNESGLTTALSGKADLENGKIKESQLPDVVLGQMVFGGLISWDEAATAWVIDTPSDGLVLRIGEEVSTGTFLSELNEENLSGVYFICSTNGGTDWSLDVDTPDVTVGDWFVYTGSRWAKVDNTDAVASVAGLTGTITADNLADKLIDSNNTNPLATKGDVTNVKVSASGDDYISASADTTGRTISIAATASLTTAVSKANSAYQKPSTGIPTSDLKDGSKLTNAIQGASSSTYITASVSNDKKITATAKVEGMDSTTTGLVTNTSVKTYVDSMWEWEVISD